jgi:hypothetical protein
MSAKFTSINSLEKPCCGLALLLCSRHGCHFPLGTKCSPIAISFKHQAPAHCAALDTVGSPMLSLRLSVAYLAPFALAILRVSVSCATVPIHAVPQVVSKAIFAYFTLIGLARSILRDGCDRLSAVLEQERYTHHTSLGVRFAKTENRSTERPWTLSMNSFQDAVTRGAAPVTRDQMRQRTRSALRSPLQLPAGFSVAVCRPR